MLEEVFPFLVTLNQLRNACLAEYLGSMKLQFSDMLSASASGYYCGLQEKNIYTEQANFIPSTYQSVG